MENKSIIPIIESKYDSFTNTEKSVADFFIHNTESIDFSASNISKLIFTSEAALSRFARKCGYSGYREFKYLYERSIADRPETRKANVLPVLNVYQELISKTYSLVDEAQINRIVEEIYKKKRIVVCGVGSSGLAAQEMENRFMRIGVDIDSLQEYDRIRMKAASIDDTDMILGISVSGTSESVLFLLQVAKSKGAGTVLITANNKAVFKEVCDDVLLIASTKHLEAGNTISPQFPVLVMVDILYYEYLSRNTKEKKAIHEDSLRMLHSRDFPVNQKLL